MKSIKTRQRVVIVTTIITLSYLLLQDSSVVEFFDLDLGFDPIRPLLLAALAYLGIFWIVFFKVRGERFFTILMFPALSVFALSLFAELLVDNALEGLGRFGVLFVSVIVFWIFTYLTLLTANILNAAYLHEVPLGQAARAAQFILSLIIAYIIYFIIFSNDIFIILKIIGIAATSLLVTFISLANINLKLKQRLTSSFNIGLLLTFVGMILSIWPVSAPYLALVLSLLLYVSLGIALEIREIISKWIWVEYTILILLVFVMLLLLAEWGINGVII